MSELSQGNYPSLVKVSSLWASQLFFSVTLLAVVNFKDNGNNTDIVPYFWE